MSEAQRQPQARAGGHEPPVGGGGGGKGPLPVALSREQIRAMVRAVAGPQAVRDRALILLAFATAARRSELTAMDWEGVDFGRARVRFWRRKVSSWHEVPIGDVPQAVDALKALSQERRAALGTIAPLHGPVFLSLRGGRLTRNGLWRIFDRWGQAAGIPPEKARPHCVRHGRAVALIEDGAALLAVQHLLGHASLVSTSCYTRVAVGWLEGELGKSGL